MKVNGPCTGVLLVCLAALTGISKGEERYFPVNQDDLVPDRLAKELLYEDQFQSDASLKNWVLEGPGEIGWSKGQMVLVNDASEPLLKAWEDGGRRNVDVPTYYRIIQQAVEQKRPGMVAKLKDAKGNFLGGHITCWNNQVVAPADFYLEYEFHPRSPIGLGIVHFCAIGREGEDVLDPALVPRYGVFSSYIRGDINAYHISYWATGPTDGMRGTCNLRKNYGFFNIASGPDLACAGLHWLPTDDNFPHIKIGVLKKANRIRFYINDRYVLGVDDQRRQDIRDDDGKNVLARNVDTGEPLAGGRIAIRQMAGQIGEYSHFRVYRLRGQ